MTKSAARRAIAGGCNGRVFSQTAPTNFKLHKPRTAPIAALVLLFIGILMSKGMQIFKETDLRRAIKAFQKLGLPIAGAEIHRDGKIVVVVGGKTVQESTVNEWEGAE